MKAYPDNIKEIAFLATLDRSSPYRPWFAALGATAYWAVGLFGTRPPKLLDAERIKAEEPAIDTSTALGGIEYHDAYLDRQRLAVRVLVRALGDRRRRGSGQLRRAGQRRTRRRSLGGAAPQRRRRRGVHDVGPRRSSTPPGRSSTSSTRSGGSTTAHQIVYSKGIHLVVPASDDHAPRPGAGLLRRHAAAVLRDPDGPSLGDRHDRHAGRHAVHVTSTPTIAVPARADQRPARPRHAAHRRRHHRRAVGRAAARRPP